MGSRSYPPLRCAPPRGTAPTQRSGIPPDITNFGYYPQSYPGNGIPTGSYGYGTDFNYNDPGLGHATHSQAQASFPPGFDASAFDATASQFPDYNQNGVSPLSDYALPAQLPSDLTSTAAPAYAGSSFSSVDNMPGRSNAH